jgi:ppGpp synthetase/RelA/SpoT-type nucleotidyltranferase
LDEITANQNIIGVFLKGYARQLDYYQHISQICALQCESGLESMGIRSIVTYRAKRLDKLEEKLKKRSSKGKVYQSDDDILTDIVDLAGVRIALYFPGDSEEVGRFIESQFESVRPVKVFPDAAEAGEISTHKKRFQGYCARHYLVRLKKANLASSQQQYSTAAIEIQVASVLMHAWSEVEHDLIYKPLHGKVSEDEYAILDELNGLVLSGEIALERLQKAVETRVSGKSSGFSNHYELASYLIESAKVVQKELTTEPSMGRVDLLYRLLVKADMDKPSKIAPLIKEIKTITEQRPISEQIADAILATKPGLYNVYEQIRSEDARMLRPLAKGKVVKQKRDLALGFFIKQWIDLEKIVVQLARQKKPGKNMRRVLMVPSDLGESGVPSEFIESIIKFRNLRNTLVHGIEMPPSDILNREGKSLRKLAKKLKLLLANNNSISQTQKKKRQH